MKYLIKLLIPLKNWLYFMLTAIGGFLLPLGPLVVVSTLVSIFDWVTKLYCIYSVKGKEGIVSNKMQATFYKIVLYAFFLFTLYVVDRLFIKEFCFDLFTLIFEKSTAEFLTKIQLTTIGTLMILMRESKSVDENWEEAFGYSPIDSVKSKFGWLIKLKNGFTSKKDSPSE